MEFNSLLKRCLGLRRSDVLGLPTIYKTIDRKYGHYFFHQKYSANDIINCLRTFGISKGSNIFIHCGWDAFYNFQGNEKDLIDALIELIGPEGTLAMPAMPLLKKKKFDVRKTVTKAGLLAETFRRYPGVERSANVKHSVCALGPLAQELTCTHQNSLIRFDENSPYYKLCFHNFKIVSLGLLPYFIGTIIHCVEATMWRTVPYFSRFYDFNNLVEQYYIDKNGKEQSYKEASERGGVRSLYIRNQYLLKRYFDKQFRGKARISNLFIGYVDAEYTYNRLCELAKKGIVLYIKPKFH